MPQIITAQDSIVKAIKEIDLISELFEERNKNNLVMLAYGKTYGDKQIGPYCRLLSYRAGEEIMQEGTWGGDAFFISVNGRLDVFVKDPTTVQRKIGELEPGTCFGEMSIVAGIERTATIKAPPGSRVTVLEVARPALRLLRSLKKFSQAMDTVYRAHESGRLLEKMSQALSGPLKREIVDRFAEMSEFVVYAKNAPLCKEGQQLDKIIFIKSGWVRRVRGLPFFRTTSKITMVADESIGVDFLGAGNCLGLEALNGDDHSWMYGATTMSKTEVLEVPIQDICADPLADQIIATFANLSSAHPTLPPISLPNDSTLGAVEAEIATGLVDGSNLLVMDMDLCVRCGNCSLACHKVHGQSRLLRRGIQITRPKGTGSTKVQTLLSPQVCMECNDPVCLSGCPTGAIHRTRQGYIDIDAHSCSGCFDCGMQCPYNAISMMPRDFKPVAPVSIGERISGMLSLSQKAPAIPVAEADEMVAIKCNLCENTGLNPPSAKRKSYSCEENCPTGALVRVDPLEYFTEIENTLGFVFRDKEHAVGRNIHQKDGFAKFWHIAGGSLIILLAVTVAWGLGSFGRNGHISDTWVTMHWITGGGGLAAMVVVMTYPLRKQIYRRRAGALRYWLLAHVYIGALGSVVFLLHAGAHTGGLLTTLLYFSFVGVMASGLFGLGSYLVAPRLLTSIEGEPLLIEDLIARRIELKDELAEICDKSEGWLQQEIQQHVIRRFLSLAFLLQQIVRRHELTRVLAVSRELFKERTAQATSTDRAVLLQAVEAAVTLRRVDALIVLHRALRIWIAPHIVTTSLMLALMIVHMIQVVFMK